MSCDNWSYFVSILYLNWPYLTAVLCCPWQCAANKFSTYGIKICLTWLAVYTVYLRRDGGAVDRLIIHVATAGLSSAISVLMSLGSVMWHVAAIPVPSSRPISVLIEPRIGETVESAAGVRCGLSRWDGGVDEGGVVNTLYSPRVVEQVRQSTSASTNIKGRSLV